ncbi:hypothetical protein AGABI2DRAFT_76453, partial [Agaricus bisporus var. bisporus H97]|uniref:hypothetical protein n=1 Tax=Agaricus bisporus var. bisporus (strain H97 / ATCC MYA-4626 / FGSC 10389) TaxID=936046 RepID=UPI00029F7FCC
HRDTMNLAFGWCTVVALGWFDSHRGEHLVLHDLKLVISFSHDSLVLIPSAFLWHSNVPIQKHESRASLTFFSPSGLFCFIDNCFHTEKDYVSTLDEDDENLHQIVKEHRVRIGVSFYSKVHEVVNPKNAELNAILL